MPRIVNIAAAAFASLLVCSVAGAQMRGGFSGARVSSMRAAPVGRISPGIARAMGQVRLIQPSPAGQMISGFTPFSNSISFSRTNGVPGLGFDYPHLAAISGGLRNGRYSNFGRRGQRGQAGFVPIIVGGYPYYDYGYGCGYDDTLDDSDQSQAQYQYAPQPQQQPTPQVIVIQQPVPVAQPAPDAVGEILAPPAPRAAEPSRDVGEFVLVRKDGRILFASAFSVAGTQLTYITSEGIRHIVPLNELDADATQQMNEARGTTVQLHN